MLVMIFRRSSMDAAESENLLFQTSWSGVVLKCYPHRLHCLVSRREPQDGQRGPLSSRVKEGESKKKTPPTTTTTIPSLSSLDMPSKQRLVIKLTSQQASALAFASWSIVTHWGGNSSFQGIPGQKAEMTSTHRSSPGTVEWEQSTCHCVVRGQPFNPGQPWSTETDFLFLFLGFFFDVAPLSCHTQREGEDAEGRQSQGPLHPPLHISLQHD